MSVMTKKTILIASASAAFLMAPAAATWGSWGGSGWTSGWGGYSPTHRHYCNCGHSGSCGTTSGGTTSGGTTSGGTTSGGTTSGGTTSGGTTSGGTTTSTGGSSGGTSTGGSTPVPEPGVLGLFALGLGGLAVARRRRSRRQPATA